MNSKFNNFAQEWVDASLTGESTRSISIRYGVSEWAVKNQFHRIGHIPAIWQKDALSNVDAAWIAAVLDCEGTMSIHTPWNKSRNCRNIQVFSRVEMVDNGIPERLCYLCGGSVLGPISQKGNRKPHYLWNITANGLRWLLPQIMPYLIVKKRHAEIMLKVLGGNRRGVRNGQMQFDELFNLVSELRHLNQRGFIADLRMIRRK